MARLLANTQTSPKATATQPNDGVAEDFRVVITVTDVPILQAKGLPEDLYC